MLNVANLLSRHASTVNTLDGDGCELSLPIRPKKKDVIDADGAGQRSP